MDSAGGEEGLSSMTDALLLLPSLPAEVRSGTLLLRGEPSIVCCVARAAV
jgi:hypothetical protein